MKIFLVNLRHYYVLHLFKYISNALFLLSALSIGGYKGGLSIIEEEDFSGYLYVVAIFVLVLSGIASFYFIVIEEDFFTGEIDFQKDRFVVKTENCSETFIYKEIVDFNVRLNSDDNKSIVGRTIRQGAKNYLEFETDSKRYCYEFFIDSAFKEKEVLDFIAELENEVFPLEDRENVTLKGVNWE